MSNRVSRQLDLLLGAYGYNLYNNKNRLRADDLLVREQAAAALSEAANTLRTLRTEYRKRFIPPPTREQPDAPRDRLEQLGAITSMQERLANLETRIRSMSVPTDDRTWQHFRQEQTLLSELLTHDYNLIMPARELRDQAQLLTVDTWGPESEVRLSQMATRIEQEAQARSTFLHF